MKRKSFLEGVWSGEEEKMCGGVRSVFSLGPLKIFLPKIEKKLCSWADQNAHVHNTHHVVLAFLFLFCFVKLLYFFFFFFFFFFLSTCAHNYFY